MDTAGEFPERRRAISTNNQASFCKNHTSPHHARRSADTPAQLEQENEVDRQSQMVNL
jgi:hypothetical protein